MPENADFKLDAVSKLFLIRVMVGLVILYDHVNDPNGAFAKGKLTLLKNKAHRNIGPLNNNRTAGQNFFKKKRVP